MADQYSNKSLAFLRIQREIRSDKLLNVIDLSCYVCSGKQRTAICMGIMGEHDFIRE